MQKKINKKLIPVVIVALAALFAAYTLFLKGSEDDPNMIFASGTIETTDADMSFMANGILKDRKVNEGDTVHRGDLIAELDSWRASSHAPLIGREALEACRVVMRSLEKVGSLLGGHGADADAPDVVALGGTTRRIAIDREAAPELVAAIAHRTADHLGFHGGEC